MELTTQQNKVFEQIKAFLDSDASVSLKTSFFFKTCLLQKNQLNLQERFT